METKDVLADAFGVMAMKEGKVLEIFYDGGNLQGSRYVSPLTLFSTGKVHYLRALCLQEGKVKTFRIDRITYVLPVREKAIHR